MSHPWSKSSHRGSLRAIIGVTEVTDYIATRLADRFPLTEGGQDHLGLEITSDAAAGWVHVSQETYATWLGLRL